MLFVITNKVYGMACEIIDLSIQQLKLKLCLLVKKIAINFYKTKKSHLLTKWPHILVKKSLIYIINS